MFTLALDENGDFEGVSRDTQPVFIAGLIYDDQDESGETLYERKRIKAYYEEVIHEAAGYSQNPLAFSYPEALHSNGIQQRDHDVVRPVKRIVKETLPGFIQDGIYRNRPLSYVDRQGNSFSFEARKGKYYLFVILKSKEGMERMLGDNAGILANDWYASNLYFHMADMLITRLLFHNPLIENIDNIALNIATRTSRTMDPGDDLAQQYRSLGYKAEPATGASIGKVFFRLTNSDMYRSIIAEEILDAERPEMKISDFKVMSIQYRRSVRNMEFLYLADSICSVLGFKMRGEGPDDWLGDITDRVGSLTGTEENLIFGYDGAEYEYSKALICFEKGNYYDALCKIFDSKIKKGAFNEFYSRLWYRKLEEDILGKGEASGVVMAVHKLCSELTTNRLDPDRLLYVLQNLDLLADRVKSALGTSESQRVLYSLYDAGVSAYCHIGDSRNAERYLEKCNEYAEKVSLEEYLNTRDKMVVFYCDYFETEKALELADENIGYQKLLAELIQAIQPYGEKSRRLISLGKSLSQRGQVLAFMRKSGAEEDFRKALGYFEKDSADYKITQSYLLHYYLDQGLRDSYLLEASDYFGGEISPSGQLAYILNEGTKKDSFINMKYAFYIFLKGMYLFRRNEITRGLWKNIRQAEKHFGKRISRKDFQFTGHPSELIFKYLCLIAMVKGDEENAVLFQERMDHCLYYCGPTEEVIRRFAKTEFYQTREDWKGRDSESASLYVFLKESFHAFGDLPDLEEEKCREFLNRTVTFMYR